MNIFSVVPVVGKELVEWLWGGYVVCDNTLKRFYVFHFIIPLVMVMVVIVHMIFIHEHGARNPLGVQTYSIPFHPYYTWKDLLGLRVAWLGLSLVCFYFPYIFIDPTNFIPANPIKTPPHVQPEWYFLFAYRVLRAVPNKAGGIIALVISVLVLFLVPYTHTGKFRGLAFYPMCRILFWAFIANFVFLTWVGMCDVVEPFIFAGQVRTVVYFRYFILMPVFMVLEDLITRSGRPFIVVR